MKIKIILIAACVTLGFGCSKSGHNPDKAPASQALDTSYHATQFVNPVLTNTTDPYALEINNTYYFLSTNATHIQLYKATSMAYFKYAYGKTIYTPPINSANSNNVVASKLFYISGKWYVYYSADDGYDQHHRMFVLENDSADPMSGTWVSKPLGGVADIWAKSETLLAYNGQNYLVWSGWATADSSNTGNQQLYISKMTDPLTLNGTRTLISAPTNTWEQTSYQGTKGTDTTVVTITTAINDCPAVIQNSSGNVFLTFSANTCSGDNYSIGLLALKAGADPSVAASWTKSATPVFSTNTATAVFAPGHSSFFKSIDGKEDWFIYDANAVSGGGCTDGRSVRMQKITWNSDGTPNFGTPTAAGVLINKPSGEAQ